MKKKSPNYSSEVMEREVKELRKVNEILRLARAFCPVRARPLLEIVRGFIDQHRYAYGGEPICKVLQLATSSYWRDVR